MNRESMGDDLKRKKLALWILSVTVFLLPQLIIGAEQNPPVHLQRPFVNPKDNPDLPNVLIIGDSISIGYTVGVRKLLDGKADVFRPATNCMHSGHGAQRVKAWIANRKWDVIHFNFGIWDTHYLHNGKLVMPDVLGDYKKEDLRRRYSHEQYIENLENVLDTIKQTKARLIWASTTPFVSYGEDTKVFLADNNKFSAKLMKDNGVMLNDLYTLAFSNLNKWQSKDGCHFNSQGYNALAIQVASKISTALTQKTIDANALPIPKVVSEKIIEGRTFIRYEHDSDVRWGYKANQKDYFHFAPARSALKKAPLRVILHSAGCSADIALARAYKHPEWFHYYAGQDYHVLYLDCRRNKDKDWWWGGHEIKRSPGKYNNKLTPVEARVLATIEWTVRKYNADRNRIYLSGISMGGSGSLGIGLCRGDIFAAVSVAVPAGIDHMEFRMTNGQHPDPPPLFNFSSHIDNWSKGQERLLDYFEKNKYPLYFAWGTFGHSSDVKAAHPGVYKFPWLSIRKDQAYPVFTRTSTNDRYPGFMNKTASDQEGQINGLFRWKNVVDTENEFVMELWLVNAEQLSTSLTLPTRATTDVTLRRTQKFQISSGSTFQWILSSNGTDLQSGTVQVDGDNTLTIEKLKITNSISQLRLKRIPMK